MLNNELSLPTRSNVLDSEALSSSRMYFKEFVYSLFWFLVTLLISLKLKRVEIGKSVSTV